MSRLNLEDPVIERPLFKGATKNTITVLPDAATTLDVDMGPVLVITPTASRTLTVPTGTAGLRGTTYTIINMAAFTVLLRTATPTTIATIPATVGASTTLICLGAAAAGGVEGWTGGL
jgi:hypothetical protein